MLKACWDCVTGSGTNYEGGYGTQTQLNGGSESVPLRPVRSTERNMFVIPRALNIGDSLVASCNLNNRNRFTANLLTGTPRADYNNVACQLDADLQNGEITLRIVKNGEQDPDPIKTSGGMISGTDITLDLKFQGGNGSAVLIVSLNQSEVDMVQLRHDIGEITFLEVAGANVTELSFKFAE